MANRQDGNHHNIDGGNDINNPVLTRPEFLKFGKVARDENQKFCEKS